MEQENLVIICEIFRTILNQQAKQILQKMNKNVNNYQYFEEIEKQTNQLVQQGISILSDSSLIESVLVENLNQPDTNIFDYLLETQRRVLQEQSLTWNQENAQRMQFFQDVQQIIQNYIVLAVNTPEFFPEGNFQISQQLFQNYNYDKQVQKMLQLAATNNDLNMAQQLYYELKENKQNIYELVKNAIQLETVDKVTIFDNVWDQCLDIVILFLQIEDFKKEFVQELSKIDGYNTARDIEKYCFYAYLLSNTMLPLEMDRRSGDFDKQAVQKIEQCKTKGQYEKTCQVIQQEYFECSKKNF